MTVSMKAGIKTTVIFANMHFHPCIQTHLVLFYSEHYIIHTHLCQLHITIALTRS